MSTSSTLTRALTRALTVLALAGAAGCGAEDVGRGDSLVDGGAAPPAADELPADAAVAWMDRSQALVRQGKLTPPVAARFYAYTGLALHAAVSGGDLLFEGAPGIEPPKGAVDAEISAAAAVAKTLDGLLVVASKDMRLGVVRARDEAIAARVEAGAGDALVTRSIRHGEAVADALLAWAADDGFATTRDLAHTPLDEPGQWAPAPGGPKPLEPFWGTLRPFALTDVDACRPPSPPVYSESVGSEFFEQAAAIYEVTSPLADDALDTAIHWSDAAVDTGTTPGHWLRIAGIAARQRSLSLLATARLYGLLGAALGDAFIGCWREKYRSNVIRPVTYIQAQIDPDWSPALETPPSPEFTSGHSVGAAAAAFVLTSLLGDTPFLDTTHEERGLPARAYLSFEEAAQEASMSQLYGGVHYPLSIQRGFQQGLCVGGRVMTAAAR